MEAREIVFWKRVADWAKRRPAALHLADYLGRGRGRFRWLDHLFHASPALHRPDLTNWNQRTLAAVWIGHATVLLRVGSKTILTDPVMANRIGLGLGLFTGGPQRLVAPSLSIRQLPPIDVILISHAHFDHLDRPTLSRLDRRIPIITAEHTRDLIADLGFRQITELPWGQSHQLDDLTITAWEVRHWGARTFHDDHRHACSFLLQSGGAGGHRVLFGGDTAYGTHFSGIGPCRLAILGIGSYNPHIAGHATPEQAWQMAQHVRSDFLLPMHHSTFCLSHEPMGEPLSRLRDTAGRDLDRLVATEIGQSWSLN